MGSGKGKTRRVHGSISAQKEKLHVVVHEDGKKEWRDGNYQLHREDGPAIEHANGDWEWCKNGKLHRVGGPAYDCFGCQRWFINGVLHRDDGPAQEYADGPKEWYINGKKHRDDGPAVEHVDGGQMWYQNEIGRA